MPGTLFVVATPIGNLEDITLRALRVLREADVVAAEDTRRTARLLTAHGIATPTLSVHEHNMASRIPQLVRRLQGGATVALVTDAGTPGVADPGPRLVERCREEGLPVTVIPGASAALAAAVASGFSLAPLTIHGFAPSRPSDRIRWLNDLSAVSHTTTFFEAPHRIRQTMTTLADICGGRAVAIGRELTKIHEEVLVGSVRSVLPALEHPRGEYTVVLGPAPAEDSARETATDQEVLDEFGRTTAAGTSTRRAAVLAVARRLGMTPKAIYAAIERAKQ